MIPPIVGTIGSTNISDNVFMENLDSDELRGTLPKVQSAPQFQISHSSSSDDSDEDEMKNDERVDKIYTVGCFDLFHRGHVNLLKNMRKLGKEVSVCECVCVCNSKGVLYKPPLNLEDVGHFMAPQPYLQS